MWALTALVFNFAIMAVLIQMSGPALAEMSTLSGSGASADPARSLAALGSMATAYLLIVPLMLLFLAIFSAAIYRAVTQTQASAFGFVRLGATEFRLLVVSLVVGILGIVVVLATSFIVAIVGGVIGVAAARGQASVAAIGVTVILLYVAIFLVGMAFYVKFSFAGPMTFLSKRIDIFGSWRATSGRFWPLFGCYTLAVVLGFVVTLLGVAIALAVAMAVGGSVGSIFSPDMSSPAAYFTPGAIAYLVVNSIFTGLTYAIYQGPAMAAYRAIHGTGAGDVSEAFE